MIPIAYINMYSGLPNPEKELSLEEVATLRDLVSQLKDPYPGQAHSRLGFSGYSAVLDDQTYIIADVLGYVQIFGTNGTGTVHADTAGICAYLCKLMTPVMIRHNEDAAQIMSILNPSWDYTPPPWEPQF
jgi:hypothetical protein